MLTSIPPLEHDSVMHAEESSSSPMSGPLFENLAAFGIFTPHLLSRGEGEGFLHMVMNSKDWPIDHLSYSGACTSLNNESSDKCDRRVQQ